MIRCELQFMTSTEHFDRFFAYKVFGKIKRTTVKILTLADDQTMDDYLFYCKSGTTIGEGIHAYYAFSFPRQGELRCGYSSESLDSGHFTIANVAPI